MSIVNIEPYTISFTGTSFQVSIDDFQIGQSITFRLAFYDVDNQYICNKFVKVEGQDYQDLITSGDSDNFIFNFIQNNLGITIILP